MLLKLIEELIYSIEPHRANKDVILVLPEQQKLRFHQEVMGKMLDKGFMIVLEEGLPVVDAEETLNYQLPNGTKLKVTSGDHFYLKVL